MERSDMITLSDSNFYRKIINKYMKSKSHHFRSITLLFRKDQRHTVHEIGVYILVKLKFHDQSMTYSFIMKNVKNTSTLFSKLPFQNLMPQFVLKKIVSMYSRAYPLFFSHGGCNVSMPDRTTSRFINYPDKSLSPEVNASLNRRMYKNELSRNAFFFPQANYNLSPPETTHQFYNYFNKHLSHVVDGSSKLSTSLNINKTEIFPQDHRSLFYQHIFHDISFPGNSISSYYEIPPRDSHVMSAFFNGRMNRPDIIQNRISFIHPGVNYNFSRSGTIGSILNYYGNGGSQVMSAFSNGRINVPEMIQNRISFIHPRVNYNISLSGITRSILNYYEIPHPGSQMLRAFFDKRMNKPEIIQDWNYFIHPRMNNNSFWQGIAPQPLNHFNKQNSAVINVSLNNMTAPSIKNEMLAGEIFQNRMNKNKHLMNYNHDNFYFHNQRKIEEEIDQIKKIVVETKKEVEQTSLSTNSAMGIQKHLDISHISNQVYDIIERKLRIEKERRGL